MSPEEILRLYRRETPATAAEAAATIQEVRSDPEAARAYLRVIYSLSTEDPSFALLLKMLLEGLLMRLIEERAERDDAFAVEAARLATDLADRLARPPRGRPKNVKTA
jgi:hypothetical protein